MDAIAARRQLSAAIARVAAGDRAALQIVYRDTSAKLFGVCLRILADRNEAEDVLQEVYITVWRKAGAFDAERGSPITWLVAIARNKAIDRLRAGASGRKARPLEAAEDVSDPAPAALDLLAAADENRKLRGCLDELDARSKTAIRTAFYDGITYEELAARMGIPLGTVKSMIRRGLVKLRECLER
jgi:RNA polymerase sigma-70 factor (ECF subfamily)